jgi:hypothetical protein
MTQTLILATASWCGPCRVLKSRLIAEGLNDKVTYMDADQTADFFQKHQIKGVPRLLVMNNEDVTEIITGTDEIIKRIKQ